MKSGDISAILDFLYFGEAKVYQENLDSFLAIAEEFQLRGLVGEINDKVGDFDKKYLPPSLSPVLSTNTKIPKNSSKQQISGGQKNEENRTVAIPSNFSGDFQELEQKVKSMMEKSQNSLSYRNAKANICKVCGKEGAPNAIKDHIEANHLEGIVIPCNLCEKTFRSRNSFRQHKRNQHINIL